MTAGIFVLTAANAAVETKSDVPYRQTIKNHGGLNEKYPGGAKRQKNFLRKKDILLLKKTGSITLKTLRRN